MQILDFSNQASLRKRKDCVQPSGLARIPDLYHSVPPGPS
jgi:hypothetical protein